MEDEAFWRSTPRMLAVAFGALRSRLDADHNGRATQAWLTAGLSRQKRLPPLSKLFVNPRSNRRQPQTWQEQMAIARMITAAHGGKVTAH